MPPKDKPEIVTHHASSKIARLTKKLSIELARHNQALGCIFVANQNGEKGFLFNDDMPPGYALQVLNDLESIIPRTRDYFKSKIQ
jgi:hypothetical protein